MTFRTLRIIVENDLQFQVTVLQKESTTDGHSGGLSRQGPASLTSKFPTVLCSTPEKQNKTRQFY